MARSNARGLKAAAKAASKAAAKTERKAALLDWLSSRSRAAVHSLDAQKAEAPAAAAPAAAPTVSTDKADYAPGAYPVITASGFPVGAAVRFSLADLASDRGDDGGDPDDYGSFVVVDGGPGDLDGVANGTVVTNQWQVPLTNNGSPSPTPDALNATIKLTAQEVLAGADGR